MQLSKVWYGTVVNLRKKRKINGTASRFCASYRYAARSLTNYKADGIIWKIMQLSKV